MTPVIGVGTKLRDYEIVAPLRVGGMATLFLGRRQGAAGFAKLVAIKVVHPHLARDAQFGRMFVDEALISARIEHPNVVHVTELGEQNGAYFLVMEYVHGVSLSQLLSALSKRGRRLSPELAVHIAVRVAEGLHAAHETLGDDGHPLNVVHRDISPQNVLLSAHGHVKLIDFGIAKARGRVQQTTTTSLKGKIRYMAPEQAFGREVDRRTDVYALAVVLWEMLTMRRMFTAENDFALLDLVRNPNPPPPSFFLEQCPLELDDAVMHALSPAQDGRTPSAQEFRRELAVAMPGALALDSSNLGDLLVAVLGAELDEERKTISAALHGAVGAELAPRRASVTSLDNFTLSDGQIKLIPADEAVAQEDSPAAVSIAASMPAPAMASSAAPRATLPLFLGGAMLLLGLGGVAGYIALRVSRSADPTATVAASVPILPTPTPIAAVEALPTPIAPFDELIPDAGLAVVSIVDDVVRPDEPPQRNKIRRPRPGNAPTGGGAATNDRPPAPSGFDVPLSGSFDD